MPLTFAVFDFDQTLSEAHVYYALAGGDSAIHIPPPFARSERGQLARIAELDATPEFSTLGGFAEAAFGGHKRVKDLGTLFEEFRAAGVESVICSRGFVGPIRKCLDQAGLLGYFSHIYANAGDTGVDGTDYDLHVNGQAPSAHDSMYLGSSRNTGWGSKGRLVLRCMHERNLGHDEVIFVDDTGSEISSVDGLCLTLHIQPAKGMAPEHFQHLRSLLPTGRAGCSGNIASSLVPSNRQNKEMGFGISSLGEPQSRHQDFFASGHVTSRNDEWCGTPQYTPPAPPPPPKRDSWQSRQIEAVPPQEAKSFVNLGPWWYGNNEFGPVSAGSRSWPTPAYGSYRAPHNLYRDDDLPVPVCCWFHHGKEKHGNKAQPPCVVM